MKFQELKISPVSTSNMSRFAILSILVLSGAAAAHEDGELPDPAQLERELGPPTKLTVYEPHLTAGDAQVAIEYEGFPTVRVIESLLGPDWSEQGSVVRFSALDGYQSLIPVSRLTLIPSLLAFARPDGSAFTVDNPLQNEIAVPLGPYYLVWDNVRFPELLEEGARNWPYQVNRLELDHGADAIVLPELLSDSEREGAEAFVAHCLSCHELGGTGGQKFPVDWSRAMQSMSRSQFVQWLLSPSTLRPGTAMPPLAATEPKAQRERKAHLIHEYLVRISQSLPSQNEQVAD
jgi:mono/diheme cytochrome c family protein